jgi:hypothetical protein
MIAAHQYVYPAGAAQDLLVQGGHRCLVADVDSRGEAGLAEAGG